MCYPHLSVSETGAMMFNTVYPHMTRRGHSSVSLNNLPLVPKLGLPWRRHFVGCPKFMLQLVMVPFLLLASCIQIRSSASFSHIYICIPPFRVSFLFCGNDVSRFDDRGLLHMDSLHALVMFPHRHCNLQSDGFEKKAPSAENQVTMTRVEHA